jgi:hypothetical protein
MGFTVEAWCRNSIPETVFDLFCAALNNAGFTGVSNLTLQTVSWDCVTLRQQQVFVGFRLGPELLTMEAGSRISWAEGYPAFESLFIDLLNQHQDLPLEELFLSTRNSQPYPFLAYPIGFFPATIVKVKEDDEDEEDEVIDTRHDNYWREWGPELHFIARDVFEKHQIDKVEFARNLKARIIPLPGGTLLDCGWTNEFALPSQLSSI